MMLRGVTVVALLSLVALVTGQCSELTIEAQNFNDSVDVLVEGTYSGSPGDVVTIYMGTRPTEITTTWGISEASQFAKRVILVIGEGSDGVFGALVTNPDTDVNPVTRITVGQETCRNEPPSTPWSWEGHDGPADWESLGYPDCGPGNEFQSPINIQGSTARGGKSIVSEMNHTEAEFSVSQSHGVPVFSCMSPGSCGGVTANGVYHDLLQFHFHSYSEYALDGAFGILGVHFVHADADSNLLVLGRVFHTSEDTNAGFEKFWSAETVAAEAEDGVTANIDINADMYADGIEADNVLYEFQGSLTTPPCSGGVQWLFMGSPGLLSMDQVNIYREHAALSNPRGENRPLQPVNGRRIVVSTF